MRFRLPRGVEPERIGSEVGAKVDVAGGLASFEAADAQKALYALLGWADREGVRLEDLDVRKPSLEDVFLQLTGEPAP